MVNTPIPHSLKSEAKKAAKILKEFTVPTAKMGPDKLIPAGILMKAKGLAILTVVKAGFLVTARGGSGIVIAKLDDGFNAEWSAPSAIGIAGLGGGFEIGAEVTDFVIILNKRSAVTAFSKGGNLTLGGNFTIAAGPLGRNLEADVALRSTAAIYTYSKTRGIFAGISVEGSGLIERKDANKKFYGQDIRAFEILRGDVRPPPECDCLYEVLDNHRRAAERQLVKMAKKEAIKAATGDPDSLISKFSSFRGMKKSKKKSDKTDSGSHKDWNSDSSDSSPVQTQRVPRVTKSRTVTKTVVKTTHSRPPVSASPSSMRSGRTEGTRGRRGMGSSTGNLRPRTASGVSNLSTGSSDDSWELRAIAVYPYSSDLKCDLSFKEGEKIQVLTRTDTQEDWWEGRCHGKTGIFPANYVKLCS